MPVQGRGRVLAAPRGSGTGRRVELSRAIPAGRSPSRLCGIRSGRGPRNDRQGYLRRRATMTESTLERMLAIFDVEPAGPDVTQFAGDSDGGGRQVVDGSQILAQSLVAAGKALPGRTVRSAHALFVS